MITIQPLTQANSLRIALSGEITDQDYKSVLMPAIENALAEHDALRVLVIFGGDAKYSLGAMMDDAAMGLRHWSGFERVAIVSEQGWVRNAVRASGWMIPCPVQVFAPDAEDEASRWLQESLGSIHQRDLGDGILHVQLLGKLDPASYAAEEEDMAAFIDRTEKPRLLVDLREFDGFQSLSAIPKHLAMVREYYKDWDRVAVIGNKTWQKFGEKLLARFRGETAFFASDQEDAAKTWLQG